MQVGGGVGVEVGRLCLDFRPPDAFHGSIHPSWRGYKTFPDPFLRAHLYPLRIPRRQSGWLAGWLVAETSNFSTRRLEIDGSYEARCACFRKISLRSSLTSSFSVLLPSQSMKMAIYYEILRNLRSIRTASKHRDVAISSNPRRRLKNSPKIISRSRSIIRIITP